MYAPGWCTRDGVKHGPEVFVVMLQDIVTYSQEHYGMHQVAQNKTSTHKILTMVKESGVLVVTISLWLALVLGQCICQSEYSITNFYFQNR